MKQHHKTFICRSCSLLRQCEPFTGVPLYGFNSPLHLYEEEDLAQLADVVNLLASRAANLLSEWILANPTHLESQTAIKLLRNLRKVAATYASGGKRKRL